MAFFIPVVIGLYALMPVGIYASESNKGKEMARERHRNMRDNKFRRHIQNAEEAILVTEFDIFTSATEKEQLLSSPISSYEPELVECEYGEPEQIAECATPQLSFSSATTPASSNAPSRRSTQESTQSTSVHFLTSTVLPVPASLEKKPEIPKIRIQTESLEVKGDYWERSLRTVDSAIDIRTPSSLANHPEWIRCRRESLSNAMEVADGDGLAW